MALKEGLNMFKKQQESAQSLLIGIASDRATATLRPAPAVTKAPAPAVKFSNDTERLQHINTIRKAPVGAQMKRVIDLLRETRLSYTPDQINQERYVDVNANKAVFESLRNNLKVSYDGKSFSYKSKHRITDKKQLLSLIRKFSEGILVIDLKDAYPNTMDDLQALKASCDIWLLSNFDSQEDIAYPKDPRLPASKVDDDLKKELQKNGMKVATDTTKRRALAQSQGIPSKTKPNKKHEITKRTKLTNVHLPELFQNLKN
ncbi:hypothetical protein ACFX19_014845 [Malus domestica]